MSVLPSAAFTLNSMGGFHPVATSLLMSACSRLSTIFPLASRSTLMGGVSAVLQVSTSHLPSGESRTVCWPASGVSDTCGVLPSSDVRYACSRYGSCPGSRPWAR